MDKYDWIVDVSSNGSTFSYGIRKEKDGLFSVFQGKTGELRGQRRTRDDAVMLAKAQVITRIDAVDIRSSSATAS